MTIQTPEFEGSPEAEHQWKDDVSKQIDSLVSDLATLTERVTANETALAEEDENPLFEVVVSNTSATTYTPFNTEYWFGVVICYFTVNAASNSDTTFAFEDPDLATDFNRKLQSRVITNAGTNNDGSFAASLTKDELENGRVEISASGTSAAPFTVNKWMVIRFRSP